MALAGARADVASLIFHPAEYAITIWLVIAQIHQNLFRPTLIFKQQMSFQEKGAAIII
jgi:hypothetical protein